MYRLYRLKISRPLGDLFGIGSGGCTDYHSGIGNVSYVKDILTETVVTTKFSCSKFGSDNNFGWVTILYCVDIIMCSKQYITKLQIKSISIVGTSNTSPIVQSSTDQIISRWPAQWRDH